MSRGPQRSRLLALSAAFVIVVTACGGSATSSAPSAAPPAASTAPGAATAAAPASAAPASTAGGGSLSIAFAADMQHLDPALAYDTTSWTVTPLIFDQLMMYKENSTELMPGLAQEMPTVSADRLTYTFKLRPGV